MSKDTKDINIDGAIYEKMLEALDERELFDLCRKVSEKYLDPNNDMYQYFHSKDGSDGGVSL